jgi:hypothetical protein
VEHGGRRGVDATKMGLGEAALDGNNLQLGALPVRLTDALPLAVVTLRLRARCARGWLINAARGSRCFCWRFW